MTNPKDRVLSALGLCRRAGRLVMGVDQVCEALKRADRVPVYLVAEAADTSEATHKKVMNKCAFYHIPHVRLASGGGELAKALGKQNVTGAACVTDSSLCQAVLNACRAAGIEPAVPAQPEN